VRLNLVGLKRSKISERAKAQIRNIYKLIYRCGLNVSQALDEIAKMAALPRRQGIWSNL